MTLSDDRNPTSTRTGNQEIITLAKLTSLLGLGFLAVGTVASQAGAEAAGTYGSAIGVGGVAVGGLFALYGKATN